MKSSTRHPFTLAALVAALTSIAGAQTQPAPTTAPTTTPAQTTPAATAPASKRPTVDQVLASRKPIAFNFTDAGISTVLKFISTSFDVEVENKYEKELTDLMTINDQDETPRKAINDVNGILQTEGYTLIESVRGEPPRVVLTVAPTNLNPGKLVQYFSGNDPDTIPENNDLRTQVFTYKDVDPTKASDMIHSFVGDQAQVTVNASAKTIIVTDTGMHVHTAAKVLQTLEKQAAEKKP